ncbi:MAG: hypothetical protein ACI9JK_000390 [Phycisphaerales bacterium]|jgi:hypothetical protein
MLCDVVDDDSDGDGDGDDVVDEDHFADRFHTTMSRSDTSTTLLYKPMKLLAVVPENTVFVSHPNCSI